MSTPTDEEIEKAAQDRYPGNRDISDVVERCRFREGSHWTRDRMQGEMDRLKALFEDDEIKEAWSWQKDVDLLKSEIKARECEVRHEQRQVAAKDDMLDAAHKRIAELEGALEHIVGVHRSHFNVPDGFAEPFVISWAGIRHW
jgi:hypothetical protein